MEPQEPSIQDSSRQERPLQASPFRASSLHDSSFQASPFQDGADPRQPAGAHAAPPPETAAAGVAARLQRGQVLLDRTLIRQLRQARMMSQQDLANDCWRRNIPLSLTTIKRAELGRPVRFRIAREFARCFDLPVARVLRNEDAVVVSSARDRPTGTAVVPGAHPEGLTDANDAAHAVAAVAIGERSASGLS